MRARILALVLLIAVAPSASEVVETIVHLVEHGDFAHGAHHVATSGDDDGDGADEHGCSPLFHHCGCCHTGPATGALRTRLGDGPSAPPLSSCIGASASLDDRGAAPPPHRPPIA